MVNNVIMQLLCKFRVKKKLYLELFEFNKLQIVSYIYFTKQNGSVHIQRYTTASAIRSKCSYIHSNSVLIIIKTKAQVNKMFSVWSPDKQKQTKKRIWNQAATERPSVDTDQGVVAQNMQKHWSSSAFSWIVGVSIQS